MSDSKGIVASGKALNRLAAFRGWHVTHVTWGEMIIDPNGPKPPPLSRWQRLKEHVRWNAADAVDELAGLCWSASTLLDRASDRLDALTDLIRWGRD